MDLETSLTAGNQVPADRIKRQIPAGAGPLKIIQFLAVVLTALALVPAGAHLFELPNKVDLAESDYFIVQSIYRGWSLFGIALILALAANLALTMSLRGQGAAAFALIGFVCLAVTLAVFFAFTFPANQATDNWTTVPADWRDLRWRWEMSHAVNAVIVFIGFCSVTLAVLSARR